MKRCLSSLLNFILRIALAIPGLSTVQAATFTVTNLDDSGPGSLRQAVLDANLTAGSDAIVFQNGLGGAIALTSGQIEITDSLTIHGPGANVLTLHGDGHTSRFFYITESAIVTIDGLTLDYGGVSGELDPRGWTDIRAR